MSGGCGTVSAESNVAPPPYRLETLGTLALRGSDNASNAADQRQKRRRLGLLAVLAGSEKLGRSRDHLLLLFWPDSTERKARHSLDQLLYAMRTSLGDSIFAGVNPLRLNSSVISADVAEFEKYLDEGNFVAATEVYRGPFLDGFYLSDSKEFEDWVEGERRQLAARHVDALEHLAQEAERNEDHSGVIRWRQKLVDADPLSTRHALAMTRALANAGDYAAAVAFADRYERAATREVGAENIPDFKKIIREIGNRGTVVSAIGPISAMHAADLTVQRPSTELDPVPQANVARPRARGSRATALSVLVLAGAIVAAAAVFMHPSRATRDLVPIRSKQSSVVARATNSNFNAARRGTRNLAAYELYVRGQDPTLFRSDSAAAAGLNYFTKAVELDPNYASAYAGLAEMYARQAMDNKPTLPRMELEHRAEAAARKAIALDDSLAEGHAALGFVDNYWLVDLPAAEKELQLAVALDPAVPGAQDLLALTHALMGRTADALEDARKAAAIDPLSPAARANLAEILYLADRCDEALPLLNSLSLMKPPPLRVAIARSLCFNRQHRWDDAETVVRDGAARGDIHATAMLGFSLGQSGNKPDALAMRSRLRLIARVNPVAYYDVAIVSYGLGDIDDAIANLSRAEQVGVFSYEVLGPVFAALQTDPRFKAIVSRRGISLASR
jgi:DNA-binding SARP family transcriptional activator/Tfp pilus assembly protein PilF